MGREEIAALIRILTEHQKRGTGSLVLGSWTITWEKKRQAFVFNKCENEFYCEERPVVIGIDGSVIDPGGPMFE